MYAFYEICMKLHEIFHEITTYLYVPSGVTKIISIAGYCDVLPYRGPSVCPSVTLVHLAKAAGQNEMLFAIWREQS